MDITFLVQNRSVLTLNSKKPRSGDRVFPQLLHLMLAVITSYRLSVSYSRPFTPELALWSILKVVF